MITTMTDFVQFLSQKTYLFRGFDEALLAQYFPPRSLALQQLYPNRPIFISHELEKTIDTLYIVYEGGPVIARSSPLDRVMTLVYEGGTFGEEDLPFSLAAAWTSFPTPFEPYKTTTVLKIPLANLLPFYQDVQEFRQRYDGLFSLRAKFRHQLLNIGPYPPQAVAGLLRAVIYQERFLGFQPFHDPSTGQEFYDLDLPSDLISRACQLNQRTVEQVLEGLRSQKLLAEEGPDTDILRVINPEALKEVYGATRHKLPWWPLRK